ncbi:hypothetical protein [Allofranklinella schreckenbergeri]|uniref:hypothetical protein n=1 Tax=Allofranklinella schreckenbergeri TaxID=1076744 RepID=UPI0011C48391|nr:hypothetical protein [Allofranklinella schreckenbergeri]
MGSLVIVLFWLCYFGLSLWAAIALNSSMRKAGWRIKFPGFYFVILPVWGIALWDAPLQAWEHRRLCKHEAGLKILKTPEQWDRENPGILSNLTPKKEIKIISINPDRTRIMMNEIFSSDLIIKKKNFGITEITTEILDTKRNEVMLQHKDFHAYSATDIPDFARIWMIKPSCHADKQNYSTFQGLDDKFENRRSQ